MPVTRTRIRWLQALAIPTTPGSPSSVISSERGYVYHADLVQHSRACDDAAGLTFEQVITGTITSGNIAPTDIALSSTSVAENAASGTTIGNLTTSDPNSADTHTYTLVTGTGSTDNSLFTINGNQQSG